MPKPSNHARPKVNRPFWEKLSRYWENNAVRYGNSFPLCQLELFREGITATRTRPDEFTQSKVTKDSYAKPGQKTLLIPLEKSDHDTIVPFLNGIPDVSGRDEVAVILLSVGCRLRGVI